MSKPTLQESATNKCSALGLHPKHRPLDDDHHTDVPLSEQDREIGWALAYFLGTLFADVDGKDSRYWHHERTSVDEWSRIARALRIHGLAIRDQQSTESQLSGTSPAAAPPITVHLEGGLVQDVTGIPPGYELHVHDHDEGDTSHPSWDAEEGCFVTVYGGEGV